MMHYWSYGPRYYSSGFGFNLLGFILQVLFWWIVIMLIIKLFKHCHYYQHEDMEKEATEENGNLDIVKERYAKGEINKKEFEQLKKDLS